MTAVRIISKHPHLAEALSHSVSLTQSKDAAVIINDKTDSLEISDSNKKLSLAKPYRLSELLSLIDSFEQEHKLGKYSFSPTQRKLYNDQTEVNLTEKESQILDILLAEQKIGKTELLEKVWGYNKDAETNTIETHIYRLRQKLAPLGLDAIIETNDNSYSLNSPS